MELHVGQKVRWKDADYSIRELTPLTIRLRGSDGDVTLNREVGEQFLELPSLGLVRDLTMMERGIEMLLEGMGVDRNDPNFRDTPGRVARMYAAMLTPQPNNWMTFPAGESDLIVLRGHKVIGLCPHHLQPVVFTCYVGYIPDTKTVGLSKLARAVEEHLTVPIMQEDLAHKVADTLHNRLHPKGVAVVIAGVHGCMRFRGVESDGDVVSSVMKGVLLLNPAARAEFLQLIGRP